MAVYKLWYFISLDVSQCRYCDLKSVSDGAVPIEPIHMLYQISTETIGLTILMQIMSSVKLGGLLVAYISSIC